jgi:drug/metabolite transporter (DMT)-like permease
VGTSALVSFYAALGSGTMGVVSPIAALGTVVPVLIGVVGGERPTRVTLAGLVLALLGAVAASGPELRGRAGARPVVLAALAGLGFGLALVCIERGSRSDAVMTLTGMRVTSVAVFVVAAVVVRSVGGLTTRDVPSLDLVGVGDVGANLTFALASQRGYLSITAVLGSLYPVVTVLLARVVLHERLTRVQQLGVATALAGVALVALGRAV